MTVATIILFFLTANAHGQARPEGRVASLFISQDLINEQLTTHVRSDWVQDMRVTLDPDLGQIFLRGKLQLPIEEMRAINLDPHFGVFRFQVTIKPEINKDGYFILEFPLSETFFYPANSKDPDHDHVIVPVQLLSLALASIRGYLAALSGDFSGFDRHVQNLKIKMRTLSIAIAQEKHPNIREELKARRETIRVQLAALPIERKQLIAFSKELEHLLGFTGEKEINLNNELSAKRNALILKIKLAQMVPYLQGVGLGGLRILHDKKDGGGQNYLAVDVNSALTVPLPPRPAGNPSARVGMKTAPGVIVRLNQALLESDALVSAEKKKIDGKIRDLDIQLKDDGLHVAGRWRAFWFTVPFDATVDFVTTGVDVFEIRVRDMKVAGLDLEFLTGFVLEAMQSRLEHALGGICSFKYVGEERDHSRAMQVTVKPQDLIPAFPHLHLVAIDVRDRELLLKVGQP